MKPEILAADWACLGAWVAAQAEAGVIYPDLHPGNFGIDPDSESLRIFDLDCFEEYPFPGDLQIYATAVFSLAGYIDVADLAAFRFGYIHHAARFGRLVFDRLRHEFGITPWQRPEQVPAITRLDAADWATEHPAWMKRRDDLELPELEEGAWQLPHLLRPESSTVAGEGLQDSDPELAFHAFERRLIIELARNDPRQFLLGITDIGHLAAKRGDRLRALTWGMTLKLLENSLTTGGELWPRLVFWLSWSAEEQARATSA